MAKAYLICGVELLLLLGSAYGVIMVDHNCTEYFTYGIENGENYFGFFTAPRAGLSSVSWTISFMWKGQADIPIASLDHYPSRIQAIDNINNGKRAQLIALFGNFGEQLPQLVHLQFNNETLCNNTGTGNKVTYTRGITATKAIRAVNNARPELLPIFPTIVPKRSFGQEVDHI